MIQNSHGILKCVSSYKHLKKIDENHISIKYKIIFENILVHLYNTGPQKKWPDRYM